MLGVFIVGLVPRQPFDAVFAALLLGVGIWLLRAGNAGEPKTSGSGDGLYGDSWTVAARATAIE